MNKQTEQHEDWMLLCRLNQSYNQDTPTEDSVDWSEAAQALPQEVLQGCQTWINSKRNEADFNPQPSWYRQNTPHKYVV